MPNPTPPKHSEVQEQRLIEIIIGPLTRSYFDGIVVEVSAMMEERWPELGPATGGQYSLAASPKQPTPFGIGHVTQRTYPGDYGPTHSPTPDLSDEREWTLERQAGDPPILITSGTYNFREPITVVPKSRLSTLSAENERLAGELVKADLALHGLSKIVDEAAGLREALTDLLDVIDAEKVEGTCAIGTCHWPAVTRGAFLARAALTLEKDGSE